MFRIPQYSLLAGFTSVSVYRNAINGQQKVYENMFSFVDKSGQSCILCYPVQVAYPLTSQIEEILIVWWRKRYFVPT